MKEMKRILSLVLCLAMLVGMLPMFALKAEAAETPVDALVIFSDLHAMYKGDSTTGDNGYKQSKITSMMTALKNNNPALTFSSVHSAGDAFSSNESAYTGYTDTITGYIQSVMGNIPVGYVWSDHDRAAVNNQTEEKALDKTSHLAYGAGKDGVYGTDDDANYYVYYLSMGDLGTYDRYETGFGTARTANGFTETVAKAIENFQADAAKLKTDRPLFIVSHMPLFDRRNDNGHAYDWAVAINAVAEKMDVAYFFGHNHNYDDKGDYYYAKGTTMPVATMDGFKSYEVSNWNTDLQTKDVKLNFSHICTGYFNPETTGYYGDSRVGTMMVVSIYEDSITYSIQDKNGVYVDTDKDGIDEALNVSVKRAHATTGEDVPATTAPVVPETSEPVVTEPTDVTLSQGTITVKAPGLTGLEVAAVTEGAAFETAAQILEEGFVAYDIDVTGFENGTAEVTVPVPEGVTTPAVYYVSDDGMTFERKNVISNADGFITFETDHFSTYAVGNVLSGNWVTITAPSGGTTIYQYTWDKDGEDADKAYLIVDGNSTTVLENDGTTGVKTATITSNDDTNATANTQDYEWKIDSSDRIYTTVNGTKYYLRAQNTRNGSSLSLVNGTTNATAWTVTNGNGVYTVSADVSRWYGYGTIHYYLTTSGLSEQSGTVRLYYADGSTSVGGTGGKYGKLTGASEITVARGLTAAQVLEIVKKEVDVWYTEDSATPGNDVVGTRCKDEDVTWTLASNYDGSVAGSYTVTVAYGGKTLDTVTVKVPEFTFSAEDATLSDNIGSVPKGAASDEEVGVTLTIVAEGKTLEIPVTVGMLTDKDGKPVSTAEKAELSGLTVTYNGVVVAKNFTLHVVGKTGNNYPEYPEEGAVKVSKTGTGIDFQSSGLAQIEVSTSGIPMQKGIDLIIMVDTSSSMGSCTKCSSRHDTTYMCTNGGQTRAQIAEEALANLLTMLRTSGPNGAALDINVAIANFNGYYRNSTSPYYVESNDKVGADNGTQNPTDNPVKTGSGTHTAGAFRPVSDASLDAFAKYTKGELQLDYDSGTNYDYAFDAIYQLGLAINAQDPNDERELYVIFMSDGIPFQWNYYTSNRDRDAWNNWLTGSYTTLSAVENVTNSDTHSYFYDLNDYDSDKYRNEHRMANAIKGTGSFEIIRKSTTSDSGLMDDIMVPVEGKSYLYTVPGLGAKMYSINFLASGENKITLDTAKHAIRSTASDPDVEKDIEYYHEANSASELNAVFSRIGTDILYAANNARFVDQMGANYNLQLLPVSYLPEGENNWANAKSVEPKIEIVSYDIYTRAEADAVPEGTAGDTVTEAMIGSRKGTSSVLETITTKMVEAPKDENDKYTGKYDLDEETGNYVEAENGKYNLEVYSDKVNNGQTNILGTNGVIYAKSFYYNTNKGVNSGVELDGVNIPEDVDANGLTVGSSNVLPAETFYWNLGQVKTTELAMRYYVYLDGSMEGTREAGSYATNNYAILYYDNYLENPCYKPTVSPSMAWKSATVSYAFYLVDKDGKTIINQTTGATGGFADRIAITNPVVYDTMLLNNDEGETLDIVFAKDVLPNYYIAYDKSAAYHVVVNSNGTGNWTITKGNGMATTTYVMHYDKDNAAAFSGELSENSVGYDYTHTVVWFAVELIPQAHPDTVVIDYGLPVDISVLANDMFGTAGTVTGVGPVDEAKLDKLVAFKDAGRAANMGTTYPSTYGTAEIKSATGKVRYTLNTSNGMQMQTYDRFMYEVYYTGIKNEQGEVESPDNLIGYYYDTVTVIPATTIYYEDNFVNTSSYTWDYTKNGWTEKDSSLWTQIGEVNGVQDEDRPGQYSLTDANNIYGYDKANLNMSTYSMDSVLKATVDYDNKAEATFTFWGTGFDIISMTSSDTGVIYVDVYPVDNDGNRGAAVKRLTVDTYYGYTKADCHVIYTYKDSNGDGKLEWVLSEVLHATSECTDKCSKLEELPATGELMDEAELNTNYWIVSNGDNAIWQVPVMKVEGLTYGRYEVVICAQYSPGLDHKEGSIEGNYDFYLDAIRIYDPANDGKADGTGEGADNTIENAYKLDHEGWPTYFEVRNALLDANTLGNKDTSTVIEGLVFIDGDDSVGQAQISDYMNFGPNNEVYLAPGQRIAFMLSDVRDADGKSIVDQIHIGIKSADGQKGTYTITNIAATSRDKVSAGDYYGAKTYSISTSTDMYYDLTAWKGDIIVISNTGNRSENNTSGIISITNIKATYTQDPGTGKVYIPDDTGAAVATASVEDEMEAPAVYAYMTPRAATLTLRALNAPAVQEPEETEPEVPETTVPEETEPETTAPETTVPEETKPVKPDNAELKSAVEAAKKLKEADYTKESFKAVKDALKAAEKVLKDKKASQVKIDAALEALNAAVEALEAKPDTAALKKAVDEAKKLKEKDYIKESFKEFKKVLKNVEKVLKDKNATQAEINAALEELNEAVEALEVKAPKGKPGKK